MIPSKTVQHYTTMGEEAQAKELERRTLVDEISSAPSGLRPFTSRMQKTSRCFCCPRFALQPRSR